MTETATTLPVTCTIEDGVAVLRIDEGKVNVVSHQVVELLHAGLDQATDEARAIAIIGRPGKLSAGFDLTEMTAGIERTRALVGAGGRILMRIFGHPQPRPEEHTSELQSPMRTSYAVFCLKKKNKTHQHTNDTHPF